MVEYVSTFVSSSVLSLNVLNTFLHFYIHTLYIE